MPTVIDTPDLIEHSEHVETHDLTIETRERPQARPARPGFWRTLVHRISTSLTPTPWERHVPVCRAYRPCEGAMDQMAREYPWLSVYALAVF